MTPLAFKQALRASRDAMLASQIDDYKAKLEVFFLYPVIDAGCQKEIVSH